MILEDLIPDLTEDELILKSEYHKICSEIFKLKEDNIENLNPDEHYFQISKNDWKKAFVYALARTVMDKRDKGTFDIYQGEKASKIEAETLGMLSEIVISSAFNVDWDDNINPKKIQKGFDMELHNQKIDVKCNLLKNNFSQYCIVSESKNIKSCDYYFFSRFVIFEGQQYINLYGYLESKDVIKKENLNPEFSGYWIKKNKLKKFQNVGKI